MSFGEMIKGLFETHGRCDSFAQRRMIEQCISFAYHSYDKLES